MNNKSGNEQYNHALPKGYILDNFEIIRVLGVGGFGIAYLATDTYLDEECVIKEYMPNAFAHRNQESGTVSASNPNTASSYQWGLNEFLNEAKTIKKFQHPNIVEVLRFFEANNTAYIVMPYVAGNNLGELLKQKAQKTLSEAEIKAIVIPLLEGLKTVHAQHIFHRDIKLSNIYIYAEDKTPILIDFGSARFSLGEHSRSLTTILTPGYSPHEQYHRHGKQGAWTDIYSMGAVMYFLISGKKPPESPARVVEDPFVSATEIGKGKYSTAFLAAIDHALAFKESDRPQSIDQWLVELNQVSEPERIPKPPESGETDKPTTIGTEETSTKKSLPTWVWILVAFLIIAGITALKIKMGNQPQPSVETPEAKSESDTKVVKTTASSENSEATPASTATKQDEKNKTEESVAPTTPETSTPSTPEAKPVAAATTPMQQELLKMREEMRRIASDKKAAARVVVDYYAAIEKKDITSFTRLWKDTSSTAAMDATKRFKEGGGVCQVQKNDYFKHYSETHITLSVQVSCDEGRRGTKEYQMDFDLEKVDQAWKVVKLYVGS